MTKKLLRIYLIVLVLSWAQFVCAQEGTLKWKFFVFMHEITNAVALGQDSTIYFDADANFYALNPDGTVYWSIITTGAFHTSPVIASDGTVYVAEDSYLRAFNPNGTIKWSNAIYNISYEAGDGIALGSDGTIYVGGQDTTLRAFDTTGNQKWKITLYEYVATPTINRKSGTIYASSFSNTTAGLFAINSNGTIAWHINAYITFTGISLDYIGNLYVGSENNNLYCFYPNGTLKWTYATGGAVDDYTVFGEDGTIYFSSEDGNLYALNPDGTLKWKYLTGSLIDRAPIIGNDGVIYFGGYDWYVYALNPNGTLRWKYKTDQPIQSCPAIGSDGTLYIGSGDDNLYALYCSSTGLANSAWPRAGHDNQNTGLSSLPPTSAPLFPDIESNLTK